MCEECIALEKAGPYQIPKWWMLVRHRCLRPGSNYITMHMLNHKLAEARFANER